MLRKTAVPTMKPAKRSRTGAKSLPLNSLAQVNSAQIDENFARPQLRRIAGHSHSRVLHRLATRHIELPRVPGACNNFTLEISLAQRPAPVQAGVIDGVIGA